MRWPVTTTQATIWSLMNDADRIGRLSADGRQRLAHVREVLAEALAGQGRQRRRRWVEDAWKKLGGPACLVDAEGMPDVNGWPTPAPSSTGSTRWMRRGVSASTRWKTTWVACSRRRMRRPTAGCN